MARYVMHDDRRWKIAATCTIDDEPAYALVRRTPRRPEPFARCFARVSDCQPDQHEPRRVFKDEIGSLAFYPRRGVIEVREKHARKPYVTSVAGIITMCARAEANRKALDQQFKRRVKLLRATKQPHRGQ
jgi:hypothetical protein